MPVRLTPKVVDGTAAKGVMVALLPAASLMVPPARVMPVTVTPAIVESAASIVYSKARVSVPVPAVSVAWRVTPPMVKASVGEPVTMTASSKRTAKASLPPVT